MNMGNTVGSRETRIAFTARKKQTLWVYPRQMEILIGSILGDAYVSPQGRIQIEHSVHQHAYLQWKYQELASISYSGPPTLVSHRASNGSKVYRSQRFWTRQFFRPLRSRFYSGKTKIFPHDLTLTALLLAVWYMDDGHYEVVKGRCILATDQFNADSIARIQHAFHLKWSLESIVRKSGKLVFNNNNCTQFLKIVEPYIIPAMRYKVSLTP